MNTNIFLHYTDTRLIPPPSNPKVVRTQVKQVQFLPYTSPSSSTIILGLRLVMDFGQNVPKCRAGLELA